MARSTNIRYYLGTALILMAAVCLYLAGGSRVNLWDRDEAWYAQTSKFMVETGNWIVPQFLGELRTAKPIFIYWCQALSMSFLGTNEFAARLVSTVAMTLTLLVLSVVLSRAIGVRRAMFTLLIFCTSAMVIASAKMCLTDSVQLLFITGMQLCVYRLYRSAGIRRPLSWETPSIHNAPSLYTAASNRRVAILMWCFIALGVLTKGPFILAVLFGSLLILALLDVGKKFRSLQAWRRALGWWRELRVLTGLGIVLLALLPWLVMLQIREPGFFQRLLLEPYKHFTSNQDGKMPMPGYYPVVIWPTFFPWSLLLPTALVLGWKHRNAPQIRFALAIIVGNWIFAEMMVTKLPHYMLPSYSSLAFLTATALIRCTRRQHPDLAQKPFYCLIGIWVLGGLVLGAIPGLAAVRFTDFSYLAAVIFGGTAILYLAIAATLFARQRFAPAAFVTGGGMMVLIVIFYTLYMPQALFMRVPSQVASELRKLGATQEGQVVMTGYAEPSLGFYQGGTIRQRDRKYLGETSPEQWPTWIVTTKKHYDRLPAEKQACLTTIAQFHGLNYNTGDSVVDVLILKKTNPSPSPTTRPTTGPTTQPTSLPTTRP